MRIRLLIVRSRKHLAVFLLLHLRSSKFSLESIVVGSSTAIRATMQRSVSHSDIGSISITANELQEGGSALETIDRSETSSSAG